MKTILVLLKTEPEGRARFAAAAPDFDFIYEYSDSALSSASAVIGNPPADRLRALQKLRWLQLPSAGTEPYSLPGILPEGVALTNSTGAFGLAISEYMVGCVFELYKKLHLYRDNQQQSLWLDRGTVKRVEGSRVLVLGMGDIGGCFAEKMKALGAHITGIKRTVSEKPACCDELYTSDALDSLLPDADIVAMALPGTDATKGIMSRERINNMKPGAILINVGRGSAVDTMALCDALNEGRLYGAALDVTDPEPLPADHPLWKCENAVITPHVSGFFHLRDTFDMITDICVENVRRFSAGEPLMNPVDLSTRYRATGADGFSKKQRSEK